MIDILLLGGYFLSFRFQFRKEHLSIFPSGEITYHYVRTFFKSVLYVLCAGVAVSLFPGISSFMRVHIVWTSFSVFLPLFFFSFAIMKRKYFLLFLSVLIIFFKLYAEKIEPNRLEVQKIQIRTGKVSKKLRITHISDLQTDDIRDLHQKVRDYSNEFEPDLILFTGDAINHISVLPDAESWLAGFQRKESSFFVSGNVDGILDLEKFTANSGFRFFDAQSEILNIGGNRIGLIGLGLSDWNNRELIQNLSRKIEGSDIKILISHYPDSIFHSENTGIDLILAGHTHGGQVCLPFFGPVITLSKVPRSIAAGGLHHYNGIDIIVSRGLGMEGHISPRIRILNRPHLVLLEILPER